MECCRRLTTVLTMEGLGKIVMVEEVQERVLEVMTGVV